MDGASVALVMNVVFGIAFLGAFFAVYLLDRSRKAPLWFCAAFGLGLAATAVEIMLPKLGSEGWARWAIYVFSAGSLALAAIGVACIYDAKRHFAALGTTVLVLAGLNALIVDAPRHSLEFMLIGEASFAVIVLFALHSVLAAKVKTAAEHALTATLVLLFGQYLFRPVIALLTGGTEETAGLFLSGAYAVIVLVMVSVAMIAVACCLLLICIRDVLESLRRAAHIDGPTGLLNRLGLDDAIAKMAPGKQGRMEETRHAIIIADIDLFKAINDTHGHLAGDAIIAAFAKLLRQTVGGDHLAVRYGGEEFVIVLWNTPTVAAKLMSEGLRTVFASTSHKATEGEQVTASFGIAWWDPSEDFYVALRSADRALYKAKDNGRNRVEFANGGQDAAQSTALSA